jgi:hypothetical protein
MLMTVKVMDENEIDADELISGSGDPRGHIYEKAFADDAKPRVDWWSIEEQISETRIKQIEAGKTPTKKAKLLWDAHSRMRWPPRRCLDSFCGRSSLCGFCLPPPRA